MEHEPSAGAIKERLTDRPTPNYLRDSFLNVPEIE
jgi:hypothetical protein